MSQLAQAHFLGDSYGRGAVHVHPRIERLLSIFSHCLESQALGRSLHHRVVLGLGAGECYIGLRLRIRIDQVDAMNETCARR